MSDREEPVTWCTECGDALDEDRSCNSCLSTNAAKTVTVIQICNRLPGYLVPKDYSKARTLTAITTLKQNAVNSEAEVIELKQQLSDLTAERDSLKKKLRFEILPEKMIDYPSDIFQQMISGNSPYAFYIFQWVPYQTDAKRWRLKMRHDVKSFDGEIDEGVWPNGDRCGKFHDSEIEFIRISKKQFSQVWKDPRDEADIEEVKG